MGAFDITTISNSFTGGILGGLFLALGITLIVIFGLALYIYFSYTWMIIAQKKKFKYAWLAWIPFANVAMVLTIGGFHWAWIFLILIPVLGWIAVTVLFIIANWRIFESLKYPGWFSLSIIIPQVGFILYLIAIGFVAYKKKR